VAERVTIKLVIDDKAARARLAQLEARAAAVGRGGVGGIGGLDASGVVAAGALGAGFASKVSPRSVVSAGSTISSKSVNLTLHEFNTMARGFSVPEGELTSARIGHNFMQSNPGLRIADGVGLSRSQRTYIAHMRETLINMADADVNAHPRDLINRAEKIQFKKRSPKAYSNAMVTFPGSIQQGSGLGGFVRDPVLDAPLGSRSFSSQMRPSNDHILPRSARRVGAAAKLTAQAAIAGAKGVARGGAKALNFATSGPIKELGATIGVVTGVLELMEATNQMATSRNDYYKKLMLTDEIPDGNYLKGGLTAMMDRIAVKAGSLSYTVLYALPAAILEGGVGLFMEDQNAEAYGMALDMVSQSLRDELGLNADSYKQLRVDQFAWGESHAKLMGQVREATSKQSKDVATRMQGLGLSGASRSDLKDSVFKNLIGPAIDKAGENFEKSNPFPTNRDVNPYGPDDGGGALDLALKLSGPAGFIGSYIFGD